jgi:hypothetical protein
MLSLFLVRQTLELFSGRSVGKEYIEGVLGPARPPRKLPNLVGKCDEQQEGLEKGCRLSPLKVIIGVVFAYVYLYECVCVRVVGVYVVSCNS